MSHVTPEVALAITRQKTRYARYSDTKQWSKLSGIALPSARLSFHDLPRLGGPPLQVGPRPLVFSSPDDLVAFFSRFFAAQDTMHTIAPGDFEKVSDTEVRAVFAFEDQIVSAQVGSWAEIRGGGFYYETWKLVDGEWYIADLHMERSYQKMSLLVSILLTFVRWLGLSMV